MNEEIEVKLKYNDRKEIVSKIKELGASFKELCTLKDEYYSLSHADMSNAHELLRIRVKGEHSEITFKSKCEDKNHIWKRIELTSSIDNPEAVTQMLGYLGFKKISENSSKREIWCMPDVEFAFIDFTLPDSISVLEIESSENKINNILKYLGGAVTRIGEDKFKSFDEKY
jgi:predicted adenylyl cyclase CyaB